MSHQAHTIAVRASGVDMFFGTPDNQVVALKQADFDLTRRQYNTVVSACMKMLNTLEDAAKASGQPSGDLAAVLHEGLSLLLRILYPVVPHIGC